MTEALMACPNIGIKSLCKHLRIAHGWEVDARTVRETVQSLNVPSDGTELAAGAAAAAAPPSRTDGATSAQQEHTCAACGETGPHVTKRCALCVQLNLAAPAFYCNEECQAKDWKAHKKRHAVQRRVTECAPTRGPLHDLTARAANDPNVAAFFAEHCGGSPEYYRLLAEAQRLSDELKFKQAERKLRRAIDLEPSNPNGLERLSRVLGKSGDMVGSVRTYLKLLDATSAGTPRWACVLADTFIMFMGDMLKNEPTPPWWTDESLLRLSEQVLALNGEGYEDVAGESQPSVVKAAWRMRGHCLSGRAELRMIYDIPQEALIPHRFWLLKHRKADDLREAARCFRKGMGDTNVPFETFRAEQCDRWAIDLELFMKASIPGRIAKAVFPVGFRCNDGAENHYLMSGGIVAEYAYGGSYEFAGQADALLAKSRRQ